MLLKIEELQVSYPATGLTISYPDLYIRKGECLSLVGPSGSGKTTLLEALFGLDFSGRVSYRKAIFGNQDHFSRSPQERYLQVAYLPQFAQNALNPSLKVKNYFSHIKKSVPSTYEESWQKWMELLKLDATILEKFPYQLSGGMKQRLLLLLGSLKKPLLYAVDEPSSGVDSITLEVLINFLKLRKREGTSLLLVSHDMGLVEILSDQIISLE